MKLTEREKWLMQRAWDTSLTYCGSMEHWLKGRTESGMSIMHDHLPECAPKPESIVKTIDPDNLPDGEVLAFNIYENFLFGHLCSGKSVCENAYFFWCETSDDAIYEVKHYIEQKDLIKLFEDLK